MDLEGSLEVGFVPDWACTLSSSESSPDEHTTAEWCVIQVASATCVDTTGRTKPHWQPEPERSSSCKMPVYDSDGEGST
eukprot:1965291-Rhodomonas_salina.1